MEHIVPQYIGDRTMRVNPLPKMEHRWMKSNNECLTVSIEQAGRLLGYSRNSAYEAAKRGELPTIKLGRKMRVPRIAIDHLLEKATLPRAAA